MNVFAEYSGSISDDLRLASSPLRLRFHGDGNQRKFWCRNRPAEKLESTHLMREKTTGRPAEVDGPIARPSAVPRILANVATSQVEVGGRLAAVAGNSPQLTIPVRIHYHALARPMSGNESPPRLSVTLSWWKAAPRHDASSDDT